MTEEWREVDYNPIYLVSNHGRVKNSITERIFKGTSDKDGYIRVCLSKGKGQNSFHIHRLVAKTFIDNPENKPQVNHINEIRDDNRAENLEWVTSKENNNHGDRLARISKKTRNTEVLSKPVLQFSLDGVFIKEWESIREAHRNGFIRERISRCCNGLAKTHKNYIWKFKGEEQS